MKDMKNIMEENKFDDIVNRIWILIQNNAIGVPNPGIKIAAIVTDYDGEVILGRRNEATGGSVDNSSHAEHLCINSKDYKKGKMIENIYISKPPCEDCMKIIKTTFIENIYFLFDHNNQENRSWNKGRVTRITKKMVSINSWNLILKMKKMYLKNHNDKKKQNKPRPTLVNK